MVGGKTTNYKYNAEGIRTEKTVSGEYTDTYRLNGTQIVEMMRESGSPTVRLVFIYDENGRPYSLELYNYSYNLIDKYYYITNVQGDVIRLIDDNNDVVANYTYDAWGKLISITDAGGSAITASNHIAIRNPIRYRGYIYDEDTKLYYCNSRYYDPQTRRFINADGYVSTGTGFNGYNMFAYCNNNPVMNFDSNGCIGRSFWSLKNDIQGIQILCHYLFGKGKDLIISSNKSWSRYMKNNRLLKNKVKNHVFPLGEGLENGQSVEVNETIDMTIENGEDIIGYQYLHGVNNDVGGFQIEGSISKTENATVYDLTYTWNDMIDPNPKYKTDKAKAEFAKKIPLADPTDYYIQISWRDVTYIMDNPSITCYDVGWLMRGIAWN